MLYNNKIDEAAGIYLEAFEIDSNNDIVNAQLGNIYYKQQRWKLAREFYVRAIELKPPSKLIYINLSNVLETFKELDNAIKIIEQGLEYYSEEADFVCEYTKLLRKSGSFNLVIQYCESKITLISPKKGFFLELASNYYMKGDYKKAAENFEKTVKLDSLYLKAILF